MLVAVAAEGRGLDAAPSPTFGRCPFLVLVDEVTGDVETAANPGLDAHRGAGVEAAQCVVDHGAAVLCAGAIGPNAWDVCEAAGIELLEVAGETVKDVLEAYEHGRLRPLGPGAARHAGPGR